LSSFIRYKNMQNISKILVFLSIILAIPVGKLYEIFIWNDKIVSIGYVLKEKKIDLKNNPYILFVKINKKNNVAKQIFFSYYFVNYQKYENSKNELTLNIQKNIFNKHKSRITHRFLYNLIYSDNKSTANFGTAHT
ncbi:MAG: hypothetical protein B6I20_07945, partial [Bacteroidetes bacterium 4572_117]